MLQPSVGPLRLFDISGKHSEQVEKGRKRMTGILRMWGVGSGNFVEAESEICRKEVFWEWNPEMKARSLLLYFTHGAKLAMTSSLFSAAKQISSK